MNHKENHPMKAMKLYLVAAVFSIIGCKSQHYSYEELPPERIVFGNGGGMTGASDSYTLLENGQLFHSNSLTGETEELEPIEKEEAASCYEKMETMQLSQMDFQHPGNRYYFVELVDGAEKSRVVWGAQDHQVPSSCALLYNELMSGTEDSRIQGNKQ